jgi:hypothetical protein
MKGRITERDVRWAVEDRENSSRDRSPASSICLSMDGGGRLRGVWFAVRRLFPKQAVLRKSTAPIWWNCGQNTIGHWKFKVIVLPTLPT